MSLRRVPIKGWQRCVHTAASFESEGEFKAASLLDASSAIDWWLRNDPPLVKIPTPVGNFEPDFVYRLVRGTHGLLEVKGAVFWDGHGSKDRIKAAAACAWAAATHLASEGSAWEFALVLEQDILSASTLEEARQLAQERYP